MISIDGEYCIRSYHDMDRGTDGMTHSIGTLPDEVSDVEPCREALACRVLCHRGGNLMRFGSAVELYLIRCFTTIPASALTLSHEKEKLTQPNDR